MSATQALVMATVVAACVSLVILAFRLVRSARESIRSRELLRAIYLAPSAQVTFVSPSCIRPDVESPGSLLVSGPADLVISDLKGATRVTSVSMAEFRMPVEHLENFDDLAVTDLLAFGADAIAGEFRYGRLFSVAVRLRTLTPG